MGVDWITTLPSLIFTRIKTTFDKKILDKYSMGSGNFTNVGSNSTPAKFPFVYIELIDLPEKHRDLEGTNINSTKVSFKITVSDNKTQARANEVAKEVLKTMKRMKFDAIQIPIPGNVVSGIYTCVGTYERNIDENDII